MRPQLIAGACFKGTKIEGLTDEHADVGPRVAVSRTAVDVGHSPC